MSKLVLMGFTLIFLLPSCGASDGDGGGGGGGGGSGGSDPDAQVADDVDAAEGPWECPEKNIARRKTDNYTQDCGLLLCTTADGCGNVALGCDTDDDCVKSTLEAGWEVDLPVHCVGRICSAPPQ